MSRGAQVLAGVVFGFLAGSLLSEGRAARRQQAVPTHGHEANSTCPPCDPCVSCPPPAQPQQPLSPPTCEPCVKCTPPPPVPRQQPMSSSPPSAVASSFRLQLSYNSGDVVTFPPGLLVSLDEMLWISSGFQAHGCGIGITFGTKEHTRRCGTEAAKTCSSAEQVPLNQRGKIANTWKAGGTVTLKHTGTMCASYYQRVVIEATVTKQPPVLFPDRNCSFNAHGMHYTVSAKGLEVSCDCKSNYAGQFCDTCAPGYEIYPRCLPENPFIPDVVPRQHQGEGDICPEGLYDIKCDFDKYPQALRNLEITPQLLSILPCHIGSLPYACELGPRTTKVASLVTIVTKDYGAQFMLLFESVRVFAPDVPFVVGYNEANTALGKKLQMLVNQGCKLEVVPIKQTQSSWFHEKPLLMENVLKQHANTLWIDVDSFLVAPLGEMPDSAASTFGCGVHTHQGWGAASIPSQWGFVNTGVLWAKRGTEHLTQWLKATNRFDQQKQDVKIFKEMPMPFLDQGPMDWSLTNTKGGFKLDPVWNVAWWVDEGKVQKRGKNWYSGAAVTRFADGNLKLSPDGGCIHLHGRCAQVVHSHFSAFEKHYDTVDKGFNTHIAQIIASAKEGTLLHKFKPRFFRYASHMDRGAMGPSRVSKQAIRDNFATTLKNDW